MVRLRTVFGVVCAESGRSSPRTSATLPNGNKAASLAVRYFNSGVVGSLLSEHSREAVLARSHTRTPPQAADAACRRYRIQTEEWTDSSPSCGTPFRIPDASECWCHDVEPAL